MRFKDMKAFHIVSEALSLIRGERRGENRAVTSWAKGDYLSDEDWDGDGSDRWAMCLNGALSEAEHKLIDKRNRAYRDLDPARAEVETAPGVKAQQVLANVIREQFPERAGRRGDDSTSHHTIVTFNDDEKTTQQDVEAVLEKAHVKLLEEV